MFLDESVMEKVSRCLNYDEGVAGKKEGGAIRESASEGRRAIDSYRDFTDEVSKNFKVIKGSVFDVFGKGEADYWLPVVTWKVKSGWTLTARLAGDDGSWTVWTIEPPVTRYKSKESGKIRQPDGQVSFEWDAAELSKVPVNRYGGECRTSEFRSVIDAKVKEIKDSVVHEETDEIRSIEELQRALVKEGLNLDDGAEAYDAGWSGPEKPKDAGVLTIRVGGRDGSVIEDFLNRHGGKYKNPRPFDDGERVKLYLYHPNRHITVRFFKENRPAMIYSYVDSESGYPMDRYGSAMN